MPELIGLFVLSALGVTEIAGFAITAATYSFVGTLAISATLVGANYLLNQPQSPKGQDGQLLTRQSAASRRRNYGLVMVGGSLLFSEANQGKRHQLIALNQGRINRVLRHFFDADEGTVDSTSGRVIDRYTQGTSNFVNVEIKPGADNDAAFTTLVAAYPSLWTAAHQGKGIAKALVTCIQTKDKDFTTVFPGGQPPVYRGIIESSLLWDPRDSAQHRNDPSTWRYSSNPALAVLDYHRVADGMGLSAYDALLFSDAALAEDWIPAANICDEGVAIKPLSSGIFEPRYTCNGGYDLNLPPKDVLRAMLATCDGKVYQRSDGAIGIRVGKTVAPTVVITDDHILGYEGLRRGPQDSLGSVNQVTAKFTSLDIDLQLTDAQPWKDQAAIDGSGGTESRDIDLSWVIHHYEARRLMKIVFARFNPEWSGRIITDLDGLRAYNERFIRVQIAELGIDDTFEIQDGSFSFDPATMQCTIGIASFAQSAYEWNADLEEGTAPLLPGQNSADEIESPASLAKSVAAHVISMSWSPASRIDLIPVAQYSLHGADNWFDATIGLDGISAATPSLSAATYDIRVYFRSGSRTGAPSQINSIVVT